MKPISVGKTKYINSKEIFFNQKWLKDKLLALVSLGAFCNMFVISCYKFSLLSTKLLFSQL